MVGIIESLQKAAYQAVNTLLVQRNWLIGYRIAEEELGGDERSEYGLKVIKEISKELTQRYGKGYDRSNLYHYLKFYKTFPEIVDTACRQSGVLLSWSHYRTLLQVKDSIAFRILCLIASTEVLPVLSKKLRPQYLNIFVQFEMQFQLLA